MKTTLNCGTQILATIIQQGKLVKTVTPKDYSQASLQNFFADINKHYPQFTLNPNAIQALNQFNKITLFGKVKLNGEVIQQTLRIEYVEKN